MPLPFPSQPDGVPWPTEAWPTAALASDSDRAVGAVADVLFSTDNAQTHGETRALVVVHGGQLVYERYASEVAAEDTLPSWSMAKSILHALIGVLVDRGKLSLDGPAPVPAWSDPADPRHPISLDQLLRMVDGLDFVEEYDPGGPRSNVIEMLFQTGQDDVAAYAEARALARPPGTYWNYSSGTSNIVAAILGRTLGGDAAATLAFMQRELFEPLGMRSAKPRFDPAGTFIGSSYVFCTAQDFARFGLLYLRGGRWEGQPLLPESWIEEARRPTPASFGQYGSHWWLAMDGSGIFNASGFQGQYIVCDPARDLLMVRLGVSTPEQRAQVVGCLRRIVDAFPTL